MKNMFVYILLCSDKSYYTGVTNNIEKRFAEHCEGADTKAYTYRRRPLKLVFCEQFIDPKEAIDFEKQVKGWSRKKKEAVIADNWNRLKELAICKNETSHLNYKKLK